MPREDSGKRLQVILRDAGIASRRAAEELIEAKRVRVNGIVVSKLGTVVDPNATILVDGKKISAEAKHYYLFHKPTSVITTVKDPQKRRCVGDYIKELPVRVFPVGRLDFDVSGLLLLTNDGPFGDKLLHPRYGVERRYFARVTGELASRELKYRPEAEGRKKIVVRQLRPTKLLGELLGAIRKGEDYVEVVVQEGEKHFVKKILKECGHPVIRLIRVQFGPYKLGNLRPGEIREVTAVQSK